MKNCLFIFEKDLLFTRNQFFCLKRSKFLSDPTQESLLFFSEVLRMRFPQKYLQKGVKKILFFSELVDFRNKTKTKQKKSRHRFLGIATYNPCAKFQGKIVNSTLVGAPRSLCFLNQRHWFFPKNKSLSKITYQFFQCRTSIIKQ